MDEFPKCLGRGAFGLPIAVTRPGQICGPGVSWRRLPAPTLVILSPPEIVPLAIDLHEDFAQVTAPSGTARELSARLRLTSAANMGPKRFHLKRRVLSPAQSVVADIDATLEQKVLDVSWLEWHRVAVRLREEG